ncbi:MAG: stage V sporulation T C-terminal domain-containing protein [Eubacteriales bacterium]
MTQRYNIAGYVRISVDEEQDRDNTSIENQKSIIADFVSYKFSGSILEFYEDRDRSGYTFEQRPGYQEMRKNLVQGTEQILIIKDFSRFSRRNSRGLVELEDLRDQNVRIISIGDNIDFPNDDDWLKIQFQFLINELPVTDTSKKVKSVVKRRQEDGKWICAAPYGYIFNQKKEFEIIPEEADVVRMIFNLYNEGWGYKRISNHLTDENIPTPRMSERTRREAQGLESQRPASNIWSIPSIQGILDNDFYIGTLRQGKYSRKKINGKEVKQEEEKQLIFEKNHEPIVDFPTFAMTKALRERRATTHYRGTKIYDNRYSGILTCGDCNSPMVSTSKSVGGYRCGTYHKRGLKGCTSHHIREDFLDFTVNCYIEKLMTSSKAMLDQLNQDIENEKEDVAETERSAENLSKILEDLQEELKATKRQHIRDVMKKPEQEDELDEMYGEMEDELLSRISGIKHQIELSLDKRNNIIQVNRVVKTALDIFQEILSKDHPDRRDIDFIVEEITVYEDRLDVKLRADIDSILRSGTLSQKKNIVTEFPQEELAENFSQGTVNNSQLATTLVQTATKHRDKVYRVNVISKGDPLEIYTDRDGGVIFKKYSLVGEMTEFATELCEALHKTAGKTAVITDRDSCIAVGGGSKKELKERHISPELEQLMEGRQIYQYRAGGEPVPTCAEDDELFVTTAAPILSEGDVLGCVLFTGEDKNNAGTELEYKLAQNISLFLGRHMEG